jgi:hypothetical protein
VLSGGERKASSGATKIPHRPAFDQTCSFAVKSRRVTSWAMPRTQNKAHYIINNKQKLYGKVENVLGSSTSYSDSLRMLLIFRPYGINGK